MSVCAVIPAAGVGSRLAIGIPKILAPLSSRETVWSVLRHKLVAVVDHVHLVVSPAGEPLVRAAVGDDQRSGRVSLSIQPEPIGMGDAIFRASSVWAKADAILVVWGDQVFVSHETLTRSLDAHGGKPRTIALPLAEMPNPYVEYVFAHDGRLTTVKQAREGDVCSPFGLADVGTFVLSVPDLVPEWRAYTEQGACGARTREINFLPFLGYLSQRGWSVCPVPVSDPTEARGINTPDDLAFFQNRFERGS